MRAFLVSSLMVIAFVACGERDKGFVDARSGPSSCDAVVCNTPPPATCHDGQTLATFEPSGTCDGGTCAYVEELVPCTQGCASNACVGEPCAGVTCAAPPAPSCVDGTTLRSYDGAGTCANGSCTYVAHDTTCAQGCASDACVGNPCSGVTCNAPPAASCVDADDLRTYASTGSCAAGTCTYAATTTTCGFGCAAGACAGNPCAGKTCDTPPAPYCVDTTTLKSFAQSGACSGGGCVYAASTTTCAFGCTGGACAADPCTGVTCTAPPASTCVGSSLRTYAPSGTCGGGACTYGYADTACPNGCSGNACVGVTCGATTCDKPPANTCEDVSTALVNAPLGTCSTNQCAYQQNEVHCSKGCLNGACLPGSWTWEPNPGTGGTIPYDSSARITLDAASRAHEVVCDESDQLVYSEQTLYGWKSTVIAGGLGNGCTKAIALAPNGTVYIAYGDPANNILRFAERAPGASTFTQSLVTSDKYTNSALSMTIDPSGNPVVAYWDGTHGKVRVGTRKTGTWTLEDAIASALGTGDRTNVMYDAAGDLIVIAGWDNVAAFASSLNPVGYAIKTNGTWTSYMISPGALIGARSIGPTPSGGVYLAMATMPAQYQLDLYVSLGAGVVHVLSGAGTSPLDRASIPVVAYDFAAGGDAKVARMGGTINGPQTVGWAKKVSGVWSSFLPDYPYEICDGEIGADGRARFLMSQSWTLLTAPAP